MQSQFNGGKIRISFPSNVAPESIKFVLKQLNPEAWHNCGGTDFHVKIRPASQAEVLDQRTGSGSSRGPSTPDTLLAATVRNLLINIAEFENRTELSLFQRFQLALDLVPTPEKAEPDVRRPRRFFRTRNSVVAIFESRSFRVPLVSAVSRLPTPPSHPRTRQLISQHSFSLLPICRRSPCCSPGCSTLHTSTSRGTKGARQNRSRPLP